MRIEFVGSSAANHSWSIVAQHMAFAASQIRGIKVGWREAVPYLENLERGHFLPAPVQARIEELRPLDYPDARILFSLPIDPRRSAGETLTCHFATADYFWLPRRMVRGKTMLGAAVAGEDILFITPSRFSAAGLNLAGVAMEDIAVVPHGVSPCFHWQQQDGDTPYILHVSDLSSRKGIDLILQAFDEIAGDFPEVTLRIKSSSPYASRALDRAKLGCKEGARRRLTGRVKLQGGSLHEADLAALYRKARLYVSASRAEAFNLPVLEAIASGVPAIATAGGPTEELGLPGIHHVESRQIQRGQDPEEHILEASVPKLAEAMGAALLNGIPSLDAAAMSATALARYSWDAAARILLAAIHERLNRSADREDDRPATSSRAVP